MIARGRKRVESSVVAEQERKERMERVKRGKREDEEKSVADQGVVGQERKTGKRG